MGTTWFHLMDRKVYSWVRNQEKVFPKGDCGDAIYIERKKHLDSIGFEWTHIVDDTCDNMYKSLLEFKSQNGHCRVPYRGKGAVDEPACQLDIWVYSQLTNVPQKASKGDPMSSRQSNALILLGSNGSMCTLASGKSFTQAFSAFTRNTGTIV